ncbi:DNA/RNA non-specific endonuclease [Flavivirga algicola]|uniref:DNA/RNA non-specific endonuclease n=1 Tax=Flavivirga algicola TaxID=2729136 RepID=A0ABX1S3D1_9FLAO|nr:DNA/RNA non-specific endonuclease [Flavivirga algicola]NMH89578.1 DNA/RNA non-specific endonuclease [Flavivirga algicola]
MGYSDTFLGNTAIHPPVIAQNELDKFKTNGLEASQYMLDYSNYSVFQNPFRKFPYFTIANIDGELFKHVTRKELFSGKGDKWSKDSRIPKEHQLGRELYTAERSDFDKGHLTKREDVQWGAEDDEAISAAESTFFFTNAVPQVDRLNRGIWRRIEDYILHHEVVKNSLKISLFTGPILQENDPDFVTPVKDEVIKLPYMFWKVIYYLKNGELHRTGFLTSQKRKLEERRIVRPVMRGDDEEDLFMNFKDAETYQVRVDFIEKIANLKFAEANELFQDDTPEELIFSNVDVRNEAIQDITQIDLKLIL